MRVSHRVCGRSGEKYIRCVNPYENHASIEFDLRGYAEYVAENGLEAADITDEIMERFVK